jgi:enamine deaminase RidA (YjgF/YER057c/UK114 family)
MPDSPHTRLSALGLTLPQPMQPVATYVPWTITGDLLFIAGQGPVENGEIRHTGRLGADVTVEEGYAAARLTGLNLLSQANAALGSLDRVARAVKLGGFVQATPDFTEHPRVVNGASDLMVEIFGDTGKHARFAVGASSLPFNTCVEVDAIFAIR